jgi:alkylated DNA repair dioxygenase AlkB
MQMMSSQLSLLGRETPSIDPALPGLVRRDIGPGAWIEYSERCVIGHAALMAALEPTIHWEKTTQHLYDREVDTPRLTAGDEDLAEGSERSEASEVLSQIAGALSRRYGVRFDRMSFALYRDGNDSVAWHRDRNLRREHSGFVATVSLGEPRPFMMRPHGGGASIKFMLGWGDLFVMAGTCQRTWDHTVPKIRHARGPRLAIMFRHSERVQP